MNQTKERLIIESISTECLIPHPDNIRSDYGDLTELAESIKSRGVMQNLVVIDSGKLGKYIVIAGHRRLEAAKLANVDTVPCRIVNMTPAEQITLMIVENVHRESITAFDQAKGFQLMLDMGSDVENISSLTGLSKTTVKNRLSLLELDQKILKDAAVRAPNISDYIELNKIKDLDVRNEVLGHIGTNNYDYKLSSAIKKQKEDAIFDKLVKSVEKYATLIVPEDNNKPFNSSNAPEGFVHYKTLYDLDDLKHFVSEMYVKSRTYTYCCNISHYNSVVYIFKKLSLKELKEIKTAAEERTARDEAHSEKKTNLKSVAKVIRTLQDDFMKDYVYSKNHSVVLGKYSSVFFSSGLYLYGHKDEYYKKAFARVSSKYYAGEEKVDTSTVDLNLYNFPSEEHRAMLLLYSRLSSVCEDTFDWDFRYSEPKHFKLLANFVEHLGYVASDEEISYLNGTHAFYTPPKVVETEDTDCSCEPVCEHDENNSLCVSMYLVPEDDCSEQCLQLAA